MITVVTSKNEHVRAIPIRILKGCIAQNLYFGGIIVVAVSVEIVLEIIPCMRRSPVGSGNGPIKPNIVIIKRIVSTPINTIIATKRCVVTCPLLSPNSGGIGIIASQDMMGI